MSLFTKATKQGLFSRLALDGPSGAGKTMSALKIARGLAGSHGRICVMDTEHGSASRYVGLPGIGDFDVFAPDTFAPSVYIDAIREAEKAGYDVIILDSLSHAWAGTGGALEMVDAAASKNSGGNKFSAWRDVTPEHNKLVEALLSCKLHLIVTLRSKMEYILEEVTNQYGKTRTVPKKIGLKPVQREGLEYEFDMIGDLDIDHKVVFSKTRCPELDGRVFSKPGEEVAEIIKTWLSDAAPVVKENLTAPAFTKPAQTPSPQASRLVLYQRINKTMVSLGLDKAVVSEIVRENFGVASAAELDDATLALVPDLLKSAMQSTAKAATSAAVDF